MRQIAPEQERRTTLSVDLELPSMIRAQGKSPIRPEKSALHHVGGVKRGRVVDAVAHKPGGMNQRVHSQKNAVFPDRRNKCDYARGAASRDWRPSLARAAPSSQRHRFRCL
jgi:hypothetical protein